MPQQAWNAKRERQYEHVKDSLEDRGTSHDKAQEIAARTVNKELGTRRRGAVVVAALPLTPSSGRRGGLRSGTNREKGPDARPVVQRGQAHEHPGPLEDEQGPASAGGRSKEVELGA